MRETEMQVQMLVTPNDRSLKKTRVNVEHTVLHTLIL